MGLLCTSGIALLALAAAASARGGAPPAVQGGQDGRTPGHELQHVTVAGWIAIVRDARERCAWAELKHGAGLARRIVPPESDAWMEATLAEAKACFMLGDEQGLHALMPLAEAGARARAVPAQEGAPAKYEPMNAVRRLQLAEARCCLARTLQAEGRHSEALEILLAELEVWSATAADTRMLHADTRLDVARSLRALGREEEALRHLRHLRDRMPDQPAGAVAGVLLQQGEEGLDAYRGRYLRDGEHRARMEAVRAAVPEARRVLARRLGREVESLPHVPVGVVDRPPGMHHDGGFTEADVRGGQVPAVAIDPRALALQRLPLEPLLVHELTHAVLGAELGMRHALLPTWVVEGLAEGLSRRFEALADELLAALLQGDPPRFADDRVFATLRISFEGGGPCEPPMRTTGRLALWCLGEEGDHEPLSKLVAALYAGRSLDEALREASGMNVAAFESHARAELRRRLERRRAAMLPTLLPVLAAESRVPREGFEPLLRACEDGLAKEPPAAAAGFLLWKRGSALLGLGRPEEALAVHDELAAREDLRVAYVESARLARASCLEALGRRDEALAELTTLARDATAPHVVSSAQQRLGALEAARDR